MNLETQQKIQNLYFELIEVDDMIMHLISYQDTCIKAIPVSTLENAIRMTVRAIDRQILLKTYYRDKTNLLSEIHSILRQEQQNTRK